MKTSEDAKKEHFNNRTIVINNIPKYMSTEKALDHFGKNAGKIVGIELPRQNLKLKELRYAVEEQDKESLANIKKEEQYQRAQLAIQ